MAWRGMAYLLSWVIVPVCISPLHWFLAGRIESNKRGNSEKNDRII